jgi:acyl-CoA dehydrogenase
MPGFADASPDVQIEAILGEAAKLSEEVLQPLNRVGDLEGCTRHDDGSVTTPKGFKEAFKQVAEGGWLGLSAPTEYGGQGLPVTLTPDRQRIPDARPTWRSRCIRGLTRARSRR